MKINIKIKLYFITALSLMIFSFNSFAVTDEECELSPVINATWYAKGFGAYYYTRYGDCLYVAEGIIVADPSDENLLSAAWRPFKKYTPSNAISPSEVDKTDEQETGNTDKNIGSSTGNLSGTPGSSSNSGTSLGTSSTSSQVNPVTPVSPTTTPNTGGSGSSTADLQPNNDASSDSNNSSNSDSASNNDLLQKLKSPVFDCSVMKPYREVGNSNVGKSSINYEGCVYSVDYDEKENVTTYTPLTFNPAQNVEFNPIYNKEGISGSYAYYSLADYYSSLNNSIETMSKFLNNHPEFKEKYYNDYLSIKQLEGVYRKLAFAAYSDAQAIKNLDYYPYPVKFSRLNSNDVFIYHDGTVSHVDGDYGFEFLRRYPYPIDFILYNNPDYTAKLRDYMYGDSRLKYINGDKFEPVDFSFNTKAFEYYSTFNTLSSSFSERSLFYSNIPYETGVVLTPFMDFSSPINSGTDGNDIDSSDDIELINPSNSNNSNNSSNLNNSSDSSHSGHTSSNTGGIGTIGSPTSTGGAIGGSSGSSSGVSFSSVTGSSGGSGSGKVPSGTGAGTNTGKTPSSTGTGTGGGHGTTGEGQGGGDTEGDGDALLREVQNFHRDFNESLNRDGNGADDNIDPDYDTMKKDFKSRVGGEMDDLEDSVSKLWDEAMVSMSNMLSHIDNLIPDIKTSFDLPPQFVTASQGRCIPLVLDFDIQLVGIPNYHFHGEGVQACLLYDSYIRPVLNFIMIILTFFAVRRLLMRSAEFLTQGK